MKKLQSKVTCNTLGFTLVELLVVIAVIAILIVIGIVVYSGMQARVRDARRSQDLDAIAKALEMKKVAGNEFYTAIMNAAFASGSIPRDTNSPSQNYCLWGKIYAPNEPPYDCPSKNPLVLNKPQRSEINWSGCYGYPSADPCVAALSPNGMQSNFPVYRTINWVLCARLEGDTSDNGVVCKFSQL